MLDGAEFYNTLIHIYIAAMAAPKPVTANITEELYKRNAELAVRNKTLSLLGKLYEISILSLEPAPLAQRVAQTIQAELDFDLVGIFEYDNRLDELAPLNFARSERLTAVLTDASRAFDALRIPGASRSALFGSIFSGSDMARTEDLAAVWDGFIPADKLAAAKEKAHLRSVLIYPLAVENKKILGALMLGLNRGYGDLGEFERESIRSFVPFTAIALDKAFLYQELNVTNRKLAESNDALKKFDQAKSEFISIAGHQLRAPLTVIKGYVSMFLEGSLGPITAKAKNAFAKTAISTEQLIKLVADLLNLSRIEAGRFQYEFVDDGLLGIVEEVVAEFTPKAKAKGLAFVFEDNIKKEPPLSIDRDKIREVVVNLVDNAIKYSKTGEVLVSMGESRTKGQGALRLSVKDSGLGIKKEDLGRLFTKFVRTEEARVSDPNGLGLGLYFVKRVAEDHGGKVWAESEGLGKGSTFVVELPLKKSK